MAEQLQGLRRGLADAIYGADGDAPWISVDTAAVGYLPIRRS